MTSIDSIGIRRFDPAHDEVSAITALLHRAYRPLAEQGMRYLATHQDDSITLDRLMKGEGYLATDSTTLTIVGTVSLIPPGTGDHECPYYNRPGVAWFQQFGVEPKFQGIGIGSRLMDFIENRSWELGAAEIALDTSEHAHQLISMYTKRGYCVVDEADWSITNYRSVIMSRARD